MTKRRFYNTALAIVALMLVSGVLSGCDEMVDAAHGAKGTAKLTNKREKRNNTAMKILDEADKQRP